MRGNCDFMVLNISKRVCCKKRWDGAEAGFRGEWGWTVGGGRVKGWTSQSWSLNIGIRTAVTCCLALPPPQPPNGPVCVVDWFKNL